MKFEIVCGKDCGYIEEFKMDLKEILARYPHKLKLLEYSNDIKFIIESDSQLFFDMKAEVVSRGIAMVLYFAKQNFYCDNLYKFLSKNMQFILTRVLIFSEFEQECFATYVKIKDADKIVLSGVASFMLREIASEWERNASIINISMPELIEEDTFKEFIKSMSGSITSKYQMLYLFCGSKNMLLSDKLEKITMTFLSSEQLTEEEKIVSALIENYPMNVAIYEESKVKFVNEALVILFDARKKSKSIKSV